MMSSILALRSRLHRAIQTACHTACFCCVLSNSNFKIPRNAAPPPPQHYYENSAIMEPPPTLISRFIRAAATCQLLLSAACSRHCSSVTPTAAAFTLYCNIYLCICLSERRSAAARPSETKFFCFDVNSIVSVAFCVHVLLHFSLSFFLSFFPSFFPSFFSFLLSSFLHLGVLLWQK